MLVIICGYEAQIVDVIKAMKCPPGRNEKGGEILVLKKSIFGLVQEARQWDKKTLSILKKIKFTGGSVDPCLYMKKNEGGIA